MAAMEALLGVGQKLGRELSWLPLHLCQLLSDSHSRVALSKKSSLGIPACYLDVCKDAWEDPGRDSLPANTPKGASGEMKVF